MSAHVGQILRHAALRHPERPALLEGGVATSFGALDAGARDVAGALRARGVRPGDRVLLMGSPSRTFVEAWFGVAYAGATVVPLTPLAAPPQVAEMARLTACRLALCDTGAAVTAREGLAATDVLVVGIDELLGGSDPVIERLIDYPAGSAAMVLFSSGTTGRARGVLLSHAALVLHTAVLVHRTLQLGPDDRVLGVLPLTHSFGVRMVMLASCYAGATAVLLPRFDAAASLRAMVDDAVTWVPGVPTMFAAWAGVPEALGRPALRWCLSAGAPLPDEVRQRAERRLGAEIRQGYGLTEATFCTVDAPPDARLAGSVGRPVWGVEVRLIDQAGQPVRAGEPGQVLVRGHHLMDGYLGEPSPLAEDGWLRTGDLARQDPEGRLTLLGRSRDLILHGGYSVVPSVVEDALASHPDVAEVAVIGKPDAYYGEEVLAVVVARPRARPDPAALAAWARARVERPAVPRWVAIVATLPLGPSGKILKRQLRDDLAAGRLVLVDVRPAP